MKMLSKIALSLYILSMFISCREHGKEKKEFSINLEGGRKAVKTGYINGMDTIYDGVTRYYNTKGIIAEEYNYSNNLKNGWQYHYDSLGTLRSKIHFTANVADGEGYNYDKSGILISKSFFVKGKLYFVTHYFENGKISAYIAMNDTLPFYQILYDKDSKKVQEKGYAIAIDEGCFSNNLDSLKVGQPMYAKIPFAAIPGYSAIIEIAKFDSVGNMMDVPDTARMDAFYASTKVKFDSPGKYRLGVAGQLKGKEGNVIRNDTLLIRVTVRQ